MTTSLCSHMAAVYFYTDTIRNQCPYVGFPCSSFDEFNSGKCSLQCDGSQRQCNRMGYWASSNTGKGELYLKTQDANAFPFCSKCRFFSHKVIYNIQLSIYYFSKSLSNNSSIRFSKCSDTWCSNCYTCWHSADSFYHF